jgi:integrase
MASIHKIRKGAWVVRWREGGRGSKQHSSPYFATKREAEDCKAQVEARITAERSPGGFTLTGLELAERWRAHLKSAGRVARYCEQAPDAVGKALGEAPLSALSPTTLRALKLGTLRDTLACLRWGVRELSIAVPPKCLEVKPPARTKKPKPDLMPDDVFATIQAAADEVSPDMGAIVHLVGTYGHRPQSLSLMVATDLDTKRKRLSLVVKGGDRIRHPILDETVERLRAVIKQRTGGGPVFLDPRDGQPFKDGHAISQVYRSCLGRSRWPDEPGIYALKRRAISTMLGLGLDPATIASITGHRRPDVLLRHYARTNEDRQEAALDAIKRRSAG